ncbi:VOC family protein [Bordetella muralis]|jgi:catechol 2,3-dioxygenase-like lactoylglutathione lyase family enzyme|uniref:VOC family protein n=1 Tax=Bordetella muralis TaxID=1649130 RepID=UPI0039F14BA8
MFSHVFIGVTDFERAMRFYDRLFSVLDIKRRFYDPEVPRVGWNPASGGRPYFVISKPFNGPHDVGNGQMTAFLASSREQVRQAYTIALAEGGTDEGEPGLRPQYHPDYFGAYFRDPDGNKLCVVCHQPE